MCALFRSSSSSLNDASPPRGLRKLFRKLRSKRSDSDVSSSSSSGSDDDDVRILRPRDTIVTPIDRTEAASLLLSPRSRRAEMRRSRASMYRGGSLIGVTYVLTAAHCVEGDNLPSFVSVGSLQTRGTEEGEQIRVANVIVHPDYDSVSRANDLALVELEVTSMQIPIPMYTSPRSGTIFGYGAKSSDPIDGEPVPSDELRFTNIDIISKNSQCMQLLQQHPVLASMFCASGLISKDACVGDSGGPLVAQSVVVVPDSVALTGVISYGRGSCGSDGSKVFRECDES